MKKNLFFSILVIVLGVLIGGWWWGSRASAASDLAPFEATGVLETRQVHLSAVLGGQVVEALVDEGQPVKAGQVLVKLDDVLLQNQRSQAQAALQAAQANLDLLKAGATQEQLAAAAAQLDQANANLSAAQAGLSAATAAVRPEEIEAARAFLEQARADYYALKSDLTSDQIETLRTLTSGVEERLADAQGRQADLKEDAHNPPSAIESAASTIADLETLSSLANQSLETALDPSRPAYIPIERARLAWEAAQTNVTRAQARLDGLTGEDRMTEAAQEAAQAALVDAQGLVAKAQAAYQALTSGPSWIKLEAAWAEVQRARAQLAGFRVSGQPNPGGALLPVETLLIQVDAASAARDVAEANLESIKQGARSEQITAAQAQVDGARAQLKGIDEQIKKLTLTAPSDGFVLTRAVEPGEMALPGGTLLTIAQLDVLELTVYLPEDRFGLAELGQPVAVQVDAYPGQTLQGSVIRIADEAEFTPTNVQTKEDRSRLVYAVVIRLENPDLLLKPGMIADVTFGEK